MIVKTAKGAEQYQTAPMYRRDEFKTENRKSIRTQTKTYPKNKSKSTQKIS